jgi:hypothetical protein
MQQDNSKAGTKRLFSNRESKLSSEAEDYGENAEREASDEVLHSGKRQRSSGWPLPDTSNRSPLQNRKPPNSPSSPRRPVSQARSSKFVEGSMNDRISQKPPTTYTGTEEELRSKFDYDEQDVRGRKLARPRKFTTRGSGSVAPPSVADRSEASRHSSIFRFGKSLAATFNPTNWKIWSKQQSQVEDEELAHLQALRERKQKAEKMYQELKEAGQIRGRSVGPRDRPLGSDPTILQNKHDSGIEFARYDAGNRRMSRETSREDKRRGRVFLEPPKILRDQRDESPASNVGSVAASIVSTPKQSFHFKKPSLSNLKKVLTNENAPDDNQYQRPVHRVPSRKDMQKQQKLVKRVSDLEGKLEAARRQLAEALEEPIPDQPTPKIGREIGRSRFVPGALASLPSERLLSGYVASSPGFSDNESNIEVGMAVTLDDVKDNGASGQNSVVPNVAASPSWVGKPLTQSGTPPQDRVLPSVEREESIQETAVSNVGHIVETATTISEPSTRAYDPNDGDYVEGPSERETTPKPQRAKPATEKTPTKKTPTKKRKSIFEGQADDGGRYKPSQDSGSDPESEVKKPTPKKKSTATARPRKLQKTTQESDDDSNPKTSATKAESGTATGSGSINRNNSSTKAPTSAPSVPSRTNSLKGGKKLISPPPPSQKSKIAPKAQQSFSPPPSSSFTGLDYMKPSVARQTVKHVGELVGSDIAYSADPTTDDGVPPMPTMPKAIRLHSGEIIRTTAASFASTTSKTSKTSKISKSSGPTKLTKPRPAPKESEKRENKSKKQEPDDDFHWDRDTF